MFDCFHLLEHAVGGYSGQRRLNKAHNLKTHWYNFKARGAWNMPKRSSNLSQNNHTQKGQAKKVQDKRKQKTAVSVPGWWGEGRGGGSMVVCSETICHVQLRRCHHLRSHTSNNINHWLIYQFHHNNHHCYHWPHSPSYCYPVATPPSVGHCLAPHLQTERGWFFNKLPS